WILFRRCRGRVKNCASGCWESGGTNCLKRRFGRKRPSLPQTRESREKKNWIPVSTGMTHNEADQSTERTKMAPRSSRRVHTYFFLNFVLFATFVVICALAIGGCPGATNVTSIDYRLRRLRSNASIDGWIHQTGRARAQLACAAASRNLDADVELLRLRCLRDFFVLLSDCADHWETADGNSGFPGSTTPSVLCLHKHKKRHRRTEGSGGEASRFGGISADGEGGGARDAEAQMRGQFEKY